MKIECLKRMNRCEQIYDEFIAHECGWIKWSMFLNNAREILRNPKLNNGDLIKYLWSTCRIPENQLLDNSTIKLRCAREGIMKDGKLNKIALAFDVGTYNSISVKFDQSIEQIQDALKKAFDLEECE